MANTLSVPISTGQRVVYIDNDNVTSAASDDMEFTVNTPNLSGVRSVAVDSIQLQSTLPTFSPNNNEFALLMAQDTSGVPLLPENGSGIDDARYESVFFDTDTHYSSIIALVNGLNTTMGLAGPAPLQMQNYNFDWIDNHLIIQATVPPPAGVYLFCLLPVDHPRMSDRIRACYKKLGFTPQQWGLHPKLPVETVTQAMLGGHPTGWTRKLVAVMSPLREYSRNVFVTMDACAPSAVSTSDEEENPTSNILVSLPLPANNQQADFNLSKRHPISVTQEHLRLLRFRVKDDSMADMPPFGLRFSIQLRAEVSK